MKTKEIEPVIAFESWSRQAEPDGYWVVRLRAYSDGTAKVHRAPKHKDDRGDVPVAGYYLDEGKSHMPRAAWQVLAPTGWQKVPPPVAASAMATA